MGKNVCFTLEINGVPVLVISAASLPPAFRRVSEDWLLEELGRLRSNGKPIFLSLDEGHVRPAHPDENAKLQLERASDQLRGEDTKYAFAFLIPVDAEPN